MKLSPHFSLEELTTTSQPYQNVPEQQHIIALSALCWAVLEPLRLAFGGPLRVSSGYRSPHVNAAVGSTAKSQHLLGEAADIAPVDIDRLYLWRVVMAASEQLIQPLPIDQALIYEGTGHVHVSYSLSHAPRHQLLVHTAQGYVAWRSYQGRLRRELEALP